ncbi:MAG: hypothetical protein WDO74_36625 [Pseudomonadota bacterium]
MNDDNKRRALQNLRARPERAEWEEVRVPSPDGEIELFARVGDDRTASDLIDPEFLQAAFERCGKATVFFAVPHAPVDGHGVAPRPGSENGSSPPRRQRSR